jgi:hypothetical protein
MAAEAAVVQDIVMHYTHLHLVQQIQAAVAAEPQQAKQQAQAVQGMQKLPIGHKENK